MTQTITYKDGTTFNLSIQSGYSISIAQEGLKRVRFMAMSPDQRLFVTDMHDLSDNKLGRVYILDHFNSKTKKFESQKIYLDNLRNPNSITFYTDKQGTQWIYVALTDKLVRYQYQNGELSPAHAPETLATFPDYGLSYKYGGWHLTRTVAIHNDKVYVSVGSSCNSCEEKESVRASIVEMDLDGKNEKFYAEGLRNAVGIKWVDNTLFATNMGVDHLGTSSPEEMFYAITPRQNYGWPYCYVKDKKVYTDTTIALANKNTNCDNVETPYAVFPCSCSSTWIRIFLRNF